MISQGCSSNELDIPEIWILRRGAPLLRTLVLRIFQELTAAFLTRFDMMNKRLYKTYVNLTNFVVRVSDGTAASKEHAVLVNAHLDSTLPSPGAADDALSVGAMLECMRVLVETPGWTPTWSIIFCTVFISWVFWAMC
jgi:hypothetical protein